MLRFQPDWCLSFYKQSIHQQCIQPIECFLNYKNGEFHPVDDPNLDTSKPKIDVLQLDLTNLIEV